MRSSGSRAVAAQGRAHGRGRRGRRLPDQRQGGDQGRDEGRQDEAAHRRDLQSRIRRQAGAGPELVEHGGQHQHEQQAAGRRHLEVGLHPAALVVLRRQLPGPGRDRDLDHRPADVEHHQPDAEPGGAGPAHPEQPRHEDRCGRQREQRRAGGDPRLAPAKPTAAAVRQHPDQRVGHCVPHPAEHEDQPDGAQTEPQLLGVVGRQVDRQRQARTGQRYRQGGEHRQPPGGQTLGSRPAHRAPSPSSGRSR